MRIRKVVALDPKSPGDHVFAGIPPLPRLGLPILGTILAKFGIEIKIYIEDLGRIDWGEVRDADLVLLSSLTATAPRAYKFAQRVKSMGIPTVMGGFHATFMPEETLAYTDYVIRGEGEQAIVEFIEALQDKRSFAEVSNLSYRNKAGEISHHPLSRRIENLDEIPNPDLSLIANWTRRIIVPIQFSRGCPYNCEFCVVTQMCGHQLRYYGIDRIINQIRQSAAEPEMEFIFFIDDNFTANPLKTKELLRQMIAKLDRIPIWTAQVSVHAAKDPELLELMKATGCKFVYVGFESVETDTLKEYRKPQQPEDIRKCVRSFHRFGIKVHGMFVLGGDNDTQETPQKTLRFAQNLGIDTVQFLILTPLPGSKVSQKLQEQGRILVSDWSLYDGHHVTFMPAQMDPYTLQTEMIKAMQGFYSRTQIAKQWFLLMLRLHQLFPALFSKKWRWRLFINLQLIKTGRQVIKKWLADQRSIAFLNRLFSHWRKNL